MKCCPTILVMLAFAQAVNATTITVAESLQRAVDSAKAGDTVVVVGPREYHEHVIIGKSVELRGRNNPVIDADARGCALKIEAEGVVVSGITVRNSGIDLGAPDAGILIRASQTVVENVRVEGGGFGIYLRASDHCQIVSNTIIGSPNVPNAKRGNGIHLWKCKSNVIAHNTVIGSRDGMYFSYADQNIIASNRVEQTRFGIHYMYSHQNRLLGNTLTGNSVGAALMFARDCVVEDNRAFANLRHGILLKQVETSRFVHNAIYGQNRGLFIQQAEQDRFEQNLICENDIGLYLSNGSEKNIFVGNAFIGNADQVWQPSDEVEMGRLASNEFHKGHWGNFWSDYTGSDNNGDGVGDTPYHETDVLGYIVDHHPEARIFALSPAAALLRKSEEVLPLLNVQGVTDPWPLMTPCGTPSISYSRTTVSGPAVPKTEANSGRSIRFATYHVENETGQ